MGENGRGLLPLNMFVLFVIEKMFYSYEPLEHFSIKSKTNSMRWCPQVETFED